ncbi:MAG: DUF1428 family protein [Candidatus Nitrosocosmicus sp.]|nr:DUF1428 family protein [Candidatus Nitrosocosmicus sp.]
MSNTNTSSNQKGSRGHIEIFLYRAPKKNHDEMVQVNIQSKDFFTRHGASGFEVFSLENRENVMEFVNLSKTISASEEEEVWLEIQSYRNAEHMKEFTARMQGDKSIEPIYKRFMELITPGSMVTFGGFNRIEEIS